MRMHYFFVRKAAGGGGGGTIEVSAITLLNMCVDTKIALYRTSCIYAHV